MRLLFGWEEHKTQWACNNRQGCQWLIIYPWSGRIPSFLCSVHKNDQLHGRRTWAGASLAQHAHHPGLSHYAAAETAESPSRGSAYETLRSGWLSRAGGSRAAAGMTWRLGCGVAGSVQCTLGLLPPRRTLLLSWIWAPPPARPRGPASASPGNQREPTATVTDGNASWETKPGTMKQVFLLIISIRSSFHPGKAHLTMINFWHTEKTWRKMISVLV